MASWGWGAARGGAGAGAGGEPPPEGVAGDAPRAEALGRGGAGGGGGGAPPAAQASGSGGASVPNLAAPGGARRAAAPTAGLGPGSTPASGGPRMRQRERLRTLLGAPIVDLAQLRQACWGGVPMDMRPMCWQLLLGLLPPDSAKWATTAGARRRKYWDLLQRYERAERSEGTEEEAVLARQIAIDIPRTATDLPFFSQGRVRRSLTRLLYLRAVMHPLSGYVQGFNDIATPFLATFLSRLMHGPMKEWDVAAVPEDRLLEAESDCFWCFCRFLEHVEDYYTPEQPGIRRGIDQLESLVRRIDVGLHEHLEAEGVEYLHFSFRWFNCLVVRELPFQLVLRLWDTFMAEGAAVRSFLLYVCLSLLLRWRGELRGMELQDAILFLQKLPTQVWDEGDLEVLLSTAFMWQSVFDETIKGGARSQAPGAPYPLA